MAPSHALRCCKRALNWIPVLFINLVVGWSYYAYVVELCVYTIPNNAERISYLVIFHIFFTMFIWSYWKTIGSRPASPPKAFSLPRVEKELYEREERAETQQEVLKKVARSLPVYTRTAGGAIRYCDHCQVIKPDRCHHCTTCEMCVLKMDHHCPWVNNCVGFSNYKYFVLFLTYAALYCVAICATVIQYFLKFWTKQLPDTHAKFHILFLFFVAALFFVSILSLLSYHLWLRLLGLLSSQTVQTKAGFLSALGEMQLKCLETKGSTGCFLFSQVLEMDIPLLPVWYTKILNKQTVSASKMAKALLMGRQTLVSLVTIYNTQRMTAKRK